MKNFHSRLWMKLDMIKEVVEDQTEVGNGHLENEMGLTERNKAYIYTPNTDRQSGVLYCVKDNNDDDVDDHDDDGDDDDNDDDDDDDDDF
ncbi:hypothetical protein PoB_007318400 [Plakobranchus ocellatus]|uniref:Uncharacterized protein n=1 Tax=Plakobranchus ocellatus TaxID=259542 RepID=A0AAV4DRN1_9GAST|nr:hypothetical protein PoB_007318400 [Plakobranchus ocellatus]